MDRDTDDHEVRRAIFQTTADDLQQFQSRSLAIAHQCGRTIANRPQTVNLPANPRQNSTCAGSSLSSRAWDSIIAGQRFLCLVRWFL
jgi:bacterioferritin-associated ferredoxin